MRTVPLLHPSAAPPIKDGLQQSMDRDGMGDMYRYRNDTNKLRYVQSVDVVSVECVFFVGGWAFSPDSLALAVLLRPSGSQDSLYKTPKNFGWSVSRLTVTLVTLACLRFFSFVVSFFCKHRKTKNIKKKVKKKSKTEKKRPPRVCRDGSIEQHQVPRSKKRKTSPNNQKTTEKKIFFKKKKSKKHEKNKT